jgi:hypothetical protein
MSQPQPSSEQPIVAHNAVAVQWEMGGIEGDISGVQRPNSAPVPPPEGLEPAPVQAVVNDQEGRVAGHGGINAGLTCVHRRADPRESPRVLDLQAVQRSLVVSDGSDREVSVEVFRDIIN